MPSARYLLVEGVEGHPVTDPRNPAASPARYLGWKVKAEKAKDPGHILEHYQTEPQVVLDHPDIRKAIKSQRLTLLSETVAKDMGAAKASLLRGGK